MKALKQRFSQWYNRRKGRTGVLWEGRYKSVIVQDETKALRTMATYTEKERESTPRWKKLRNQHSAVESNINSLEHHGLNRCPDKGLSGYRRYVGFGVLAYNLHKIGAKLLANQGQEKVAPGRPKKKAA